MTRPPCPTCGRPQVLPHELPTVTETEERCLHRGSAYCRAASAGRQAALTWRPMETAPRDGTDVLVTERDGSIYVSRKNSFCSVWTTGDSWTVRPIAWLPLPEPPEEGA